MGYKKQLVIVESTVRVDKVLTQDECEKANLIKNYQAKWVQQKSLSFWSYWSTPVLLWIVEKCKKSGVPQGKLQNCMGQTHEHRCTAYCLPPIEVEEEFHISKLNSAE